MEIRLLAFDLDGTTIVNHRELPERNRQALLAAAEQGVVLAPATGRMRDFLPESIRALPVRYAITSNGGAVYDLQTGEALAEELIPSGQALAIHQILKEYDIFIEYYTRGHAVTSRALWERALTELLPPRKHWLAKGKAYELAEDLEALFRQGLCPEKVNLPCLTEDQSREIRQRLAALGGLRPTSSIPDNLEINSERAHKGRALLMLAGRLGLCPDQLMAVGDNGNDVTMLEAAAYSVAVENGSAQAKAAAKMITAPHDQDGLAQAVERLILRRGAPLAGA